MEITGINQISLGDLIRHFRKKKGLTQEALGNSIVKSGAYIGNIERGTDLPALQTFVDICNVLYVTPNDLLKASILNQEKLSDYQNSKFLSDVCALLQDIPPDKQEKALQAIRTVTDLL